MTDQEVKKEMLKEAHKKQMEEKQRQSQPIKEPFSNQAMLTKKQETIERLYPNPSQDAKNYNQGKEVITDRLGRDWDITLTMAGAKRIDSVDFSNLTEKEFSILKPDKETFIEILSNHSLLLGCVYAICYKQVASIYNHELEQIQNDYLFEEGNEEEDMELFFLEGFDGPTIQQTYEAFWRSLSNFFPQYGTMLEVAKNYIQKANQLLAEEAKKLLPDIEKGVQQEVNKFGREMRGELNKLLEK